MAGIPVDATAFSVFGMRELDGAGFDAGLASAGDRLAVVFFWGLDCFNCEIAKKAMLAKPDEIRALGLAWFHSNVYEHRELGRRSCCMACRRGFSFIAASISGARPAGTASANSKRRWPRRAKRPAGRQQIEKRYRPHRFQGLENETGVLILRTGMNFGRSAR